MKILDIFWLAFYHKHKIVWARMNAIKVNFNFNSWHSTLSDSVRIFKKGTVSRKNDQIFIKCEFWSVVICVPRQMTFDKWPRFQILWVPQSLEIINLIVLVAYWECTDSEETHFKNIYAGVDPKVLDFKICSFRFWDRKVAKSAWNV